MFHSIFSKVLASFNLNTLPCFAVKLAESVLSGAANASWWYFTANHFLVLSKFPNKCIFHRLCAAGPREEMNFLTSLQTWGHPFLLPSLSSSPHSVPPKQINNCSALLNPRACFLATNRNSLLDRQPWSNVFITVYAFPTQMACCSFHLHTWWGHAPYMCAGPQWDGMQATRVHTSIKRAPNLRQPCTTAGTRTHKYTRQSHSDGNSFRSWKYVGLKMENNASDSLKETLWHAKIPRRAQKQTQRKQPCLTCVDTV